MESLLNGADPGWLTVAAEELLADGDVVGAVDLELEVEAFDKVARRLREDADRLLGGASQPDVDRWIASTGVERPHLALHRPHVRSAGGGLGEAMLAEPGVILHASPTHRMVLGELSGAVTPREEVIAAALRDAGVEVVVSRDPRRAAWEKFVRLAPGASLTTVCEASCPARSPPGGADADLRRCLRDPAGSRPRLGRALLSEPVEFRPAERLAPQYY